MEKTLLIVNFGGPRHQAEIKPFLTELLTDIDVIRTPLPALLQTQLFKRVAKKRSKTIIAEYEKMGGKSPIYEDTENLAKNLPFETLTFHRYLPSTHQASLKMIETCQSDEICVLPLFPQFSYATTGSIARFFQTHLSHKTQRKLRWIRSYYRHPAFIDCFVSHIQNFLKAKELNNVALFFTPHGVPTSFVCSGDPYKKECETSFQLIKSHFPNLQHLFAYQSKFGKGEWLRPYTDELCLEVQHHLKGKPDVVFIPLSFTSDHVETLVEIEDQYLPLIQNAGLKAFRCPAFNQSPFWVEALKKILMTSQRTSNEMLIRDQKITCPKQCKRTLCPYVSPLISSTS